MKKFLSTIMICLTLFAINTGSAFDITDPINTQELKKGCYDIGFGINFCHCDHKNKAGKMRRCDRWMTKKCPNNKTCPDTMHDGSQVCICD